MSIDAITSGKLTVSESGTRRMRELMSGGSPEAELERYVKQTPAQRMREDLLKKLGMSEEELNQMKPEERKAVEEKITQLVKEEMEKAQTPQKPGNYVDITA
jgi:hypothetical protein